MLRLAGIIIFILWYNILLGQSGPPVLKFQKTIGGSLEDFAEDILLTPDGGFITVGGARSNDGDGNNPPHKSAFNVFVVKYDASNQWEWSAEYGGDGMDYGVAMKPVTGGYIILAATNSLNSDVTGLHGPHPSTPNSDIWLLKIDYSGVLLWQKCLGGSEIDLPGSIDITPSGGYIISGYTKSNNGDVSGNHGGDGDIWVAELNAAGNILWQKCYGGSGADGGGVIKKVSPGGPLGGISDGPPTYLHPMNQVKALTGGGFIVTGITESNDGNISGNHGGEDIWLARLDPSGEIVWQNCNGGSKSEIPCGLIALNDGFVVGGNSSSSDAPIDNNGRMDGWMFKTDLDGHLLWQHNYGGNVDDFFYDLMQSSDGGFYMVGGTTSSTCSNHGGQEYWTMKFDKNGNWLWEKTSGGSRDDYATAIAEKNGLLYVAGWEKSNNWDVTQHHSLPRFPDFVTNDEWVVIYEFKGADLSPKLTITSSLEFICRGKPVEFTAHPENGGKTLVYFWYVNGVEQTDYDDSFTSETLQDGDKVTCKMLSQQSCIPDQFILSNEIIIHWYPRGQVSGFLPQQINKCVNVYDTIAATRTFSKYLWSTGAVTPIIRVANPGLYWLEVTDLTGCSGRENVWVTTMSCVNAVYIPSAFTPNNDGINDIFKPLVDGHFIQYKFAVYDRNGQIVFQSTNPGKGWTGMDNGIPYNTGIFIWMCTYQLAGEQVKMEKGTVALIR